MSLPNTIGFNLTYVDPGNTGGMESYARELIPELAGLLPGHRLVAFMARDGYARYHGCELGVEMVKLPCIAANKPRRALYEQTRLARAVRGYRDGAVGLLHSMGNTGPMRTRGFVHVVTIHDMTPARFPDAVNAAWMRPGLLALVRHVARRADRVITDSLNSAADIAEFTGRPRDSIDVVPLAGGQRDSAHAVSAADVRSRFELGDEPFVLGSAATLGHKNLAGLLRGFANSQVVSRTLLVLPGYPVPPGHPLRELAGDLGVAERVRFLGWVGEDELIGLYRAASCFAFSSLYEGFGLPVLEAMQQGVAVACSDASSLPEVGGDAVLYFDASSPAAIGDTIDKLLGDDALRERLATAGRERAKQFTWQRTAERTIESYERALSARVQ